MLGAEPEQGTSRSTLPLGAEAPRNVALMVGLYMYTHTYILCAYIYMCIYIHIHILHIHIGTLCGPFLQVVYKSV